MDPETRPPIPEATKRVVRQRCGFGCVLCGLPVYQIDHMVDWAEVRSHDPENLTLLCGTHHDAKTRGLLPPQVVQQANQEPWNIKAGFTRPYGLYFGMADEVEIVMGSVGFRSTVPDMCAVMVDDQPLLAFDRDEDGLGLHLMNFDEYNYPVLSIEHNQLVVGRSNWDVQFVGQVLTIRARRGTIGLRARFEPPARVVIDRARLRFNGVLTSVTSNGIDINHFTIAHLSFTEVEIGMRVGPQVKFPAVNSVHLKVNRYNRSERAMMRGPGRDPLMAPLDEADLNQL